MKCDGCTLCCKLLPVPWMDSAAGEWCEYCDPDTGCKIYHVLDARCRDFECAYSQMERVSPHLRPDRCNVVFEKVADDVFLGNQHPDREPTPPAKNQIKHFVLDGFSVILKPVGKKATVYLAKGHTSEGAWEKVQADYLRKIENDSPELYN